jgi:predicted amidohydrolase YtcJ
MSPTRAELVLVGQVVVAAGPTGVETAEAVAIGGGRVLAVGDWRDLTQAAPRARALRFDDAAIVPGLHDFHLHLVGMARARRVVDLSEAGTMDQIVGRLAPAAARLAAGEWLLGDGWWSEALDRRQLHRLEELLAGRPGLLKSHDHHSAWASRAALALAGVTDATSDPAGGRLEHGADGAPDGVLRERAVELVADRAPRLAGEALTAAIGEVARELAAMGITGVTDAGDANTANGVGSHAELGDSFSNILESAAVLAGKLRVNVNLPAAGLQAARRLGLRSGTALGDESWLNVGWAKVFADGALGSRTAALFDPYRCDGANDPAGTGILGISAPELDQRLQQGATAGIGLAVHAIGDRAVSLVLDRIAEASGNARPDATSRYRHRIEHAQLVRAEDRARFAALGITASLQPIHFPADRATAERCWGDRLADAYPWRSLASPGALIAFGSDAPIETPNPWLGIHAAVQRRRPGEAPPAWGLGEPIDASAALGAYTLGPAAAAGAADLGHLRPGARADLAVLSVDLPTLLAADERLASVTSRLTLVDGREVHAR